jgi:hypothetical protein
MSWSQIITVLHVLIGFWFVAGLIGRGVTLAAARRAKDITVMDELLRVGGRFDKLMVIPGSLAVLVAGLLTMWAQGRSLFPPAGRWLGVSLILFLSAIPLVPLVFVPSGKRFEAAFQGRQVSRRDHAEAPRGVLRPAGRLRQDLRAGNCDHGDRAHGHETLLKAAGRPDGRCRFLSPPARDTGEAPEHRVP